MYKIYFGKDPEEIEGVYWKNEATEEEVVGKFETDNRDFFFSMLYALCQNPPAMWYWVYVNDKLVMSGAIDSSDYTELLEAGI